MIIDLRHSIGLSWDGCFHTKAGGIDSVPLSTVAAYRTVNSCNHDTEPLIELVAAAIAGKCVNCHVYAFAPSQPDIILASYFRSRLPSVGARCMLIRRTPIEQA